MTDFVELPAFQRMRPGYLDDTAYRELRQALMAYPHAGDLVEGMQGLRKLRRPGRKGSRGRRDEPRVIYYRWDGASRFWLFAVHDRDVFEELREGFDALENQRQGEAAFQAVQEPDRPPAIAFSPDDSGSWRRLDFSRPVFAFDPGPHPRAPDR